jgi:predicted enzyme related to lactoylglutathione lyase
MAPTREVFQVEIRTRDLGRTVPFYKGVFDWKIYKAAEDYALVDTGAMPVVAMLQTSDPRFPVGLVNNILVEDCDQEAARAVALGGRVSVTKSEVPGSGLYMGVVDPWGNELYLWQPYTEARPQLRGSGENPISFVEIAVGDLDGAISYYSQLTNWSFWRVVSLGGYAKADGCGLKRGVGLYGGQGVGGTMDYVEVADVDAVAAKVVECGGTVLGNPADFLGEGRYVLFEDPEGVRMGAVQRPNS